MFRTAAVAVACAAVTAAGCSGAAGTRTASIPTPTAPSLARAPRLARTRFVAFGDSLTTGEVTNPIASGETIGKLVVVPSAAYPTVLQGMLQGAYPLQAPQISVMNEGKGAETVFGGVRRFDDVIAADRPEVVLIQEGVNGVAVDGAEMTAAQVRTMIQHAKASGASVFVGSMIPTLPNRQRSQNQPALESYNIALQALAAQEGVAFVNLYDGMMPQAEQLIGIDGLHPTEAGYRRIADLFFAAIQSQLEQ
jgi:acyl-CoA thioesterase-1